MAAAGSTHARHSALGQESRQLLHRFFDDFRGWRLVRTQFAATPGMFSTGEVGMPDYLALRYMPMEAAPARCLAAWIEVKGPNDKRVCKCRVGDKKPCKFCRQKKWQDTERLGGAVVIVVSSLEYLQAWYDAEFGWLHRGEQAKGQLHL